MGILRYVTYCSTTYVFRMLYHMYVLGHIEIFLKITVSLYSEIFWDNLLFVLIVNHVNLMMSSNDDRAKHCYM